MTIIKRLGMAGAVASTLAFGACGTTNSMLGRNQQTWTMQADNSVPAAEGKVQISTEGKNRDLKVETKHLAPADAAFPGTSTYVVWLKPSEGKPINIGVLAPDKKLNAELETKTPFTDFKIMVTAETSPQPLKPSSNRVMSADVVVAT
jgi:anti-sigma-K factor RskA